MVIASSGILINKEKKILLIKRGTYTKAYPNYWAFPGGRGEDGESPEETVKREVKEEINLEFTPNELIKTGMYKKRKLYRYHGTFSGDIKIQDSEIADYNWYIYDDAIKLDLAFDCKETIEILRKKDLL